jgi:hypothetical protein
MIPRIIRTGNEMEQHDSMGKFDVEAWRAPPSGRDLPVERTSWLGIAAGCVALAGVIGGAVYAGQLQQRKLSGYDPALESEGRAYIANLLRDPDSAQFRKVEGHNDCLQGEVNGKTGFGGYAGYSEFFYNRKRGVGEIEPSASDLIAQTIDPLEATLIHSKYMEGVSACLMGEAFK